VLFQVVIENLLVIEFQMVVVDLFDLFVLDLLELDLFLQGIALVAIFNKI
jgi:hypothetical protein